MCARALKLFNCHIDCVQTTPKIDLNIGSIKRVYLKVYAYVCIVCLFGNCTCFKDISVRGAAGVVTISLQPSGWSGRSLSCSTVRQVHLPSWLPFAILRLNDSAGINMTNGALLFYSIQPVRARVFATRATRAVQSDSQNERDREIKLEKEEEALREWVCVLALCNSCPNGRHWRGTNKQIHQGTYAGTQTLSHNYGSRSTLTSFCELTGHLYTGEIQDVRAHTVMAICLGQARREYATTRYAAIEADRSM